MVHLTVCVPEEHVDGLRRELLRAYRERATELRQALDADLESESALDAAEGALVELRDLHEAIEQLGWTAAPLPRATTLSAHPEVIGDALHRMLAAADAVRHEAAASALLELIRAVEQGT